MKDSILFLKKGKNISYLNLFEKSLLIFIGFSFVFKISISTPAILILLFLNLKGIRQPQNILYKSLGLVFLLLYSLLILSFILVPEESVGILIKSLGFIFIPALFYVKKFSKEEILYFIYSFLIFQFSHILYADLIMINGVYIDRLHSFSEINSLVENLFKSSIKL